MTAQDDTPPQVPPTTPDAAATDGDDAKEPRAEGKARKERVIHTRVPAVLEEELKKFAEGLRVPVSNVIRTLLEDALAVADRATGRIEQELRQAADSLEEERRKLGQKLPRRDPLEGVIGFQQIVTNIASACANCAAPLEPGDDAYLGLTDHQSAGRRVLVCANCVPRRNPKSP